MFKLRVMANTRSNQGRGAARRGRPRTQGPVQPPNAGMPDQPLNLRETISEEITRAVRDILPSIVEPQLEAAIKERNDQPLPNPTHEGREEGEEIQIREENIRATFGKKNGCTYKGFLDCKPTEFIGTDNPVVTMTWLTHTGKIFRTSKCAEEDKVEYATNLLHEGAQSWWEMISNTMGEGLVRMLTWEQFKIKLCEEYCSNAAIRQ
ncbi:hypothetical protein L2E82_38630 [Cichorium intybus]|uniref:Uncharacterized protein n=1 Tax=Cichorium intybus TaxID=13427 RepID=A0ACB9AFK5_CICIN|nr:hypothetical protein L2E82_38630 [Cichorium intybus]